VSKYVKAFVAVAGLVATTVQAALSDGEFSQDDWWQVAIAALTAIGVYLFPNEQSTADG
jgi:hypothetical protein